MRPPLSVDLLQGVEESIKGRPLNSDSGKVAAFRGSPSPARREVKTTPKARLRHDDSQIHFAAIESSPLLPGLGESQYLTDRQKEVKERQGREAAAMFPEIRSSPRSTSRRTDYMLPKLVFKSTSNSATKSTTGETTGPAYLPDALMDDFLGSSPTPSAKRLNDRRTNDNDDLPSSPPLISPRFASNQLADAPLAHEDNAPVQVIANADEGTGERFADESIPHTKGDPSNGESMSAVVDASRLVDDDDASKLKVRQVPDDAHPLSDFDIYVDAPSVPSLNEPFSKHYDNPPNDVVSSFQSEDSSHFSVEDDQVTAQLITEMEHASSQQLANQRESAQSARGATKKRKRTADSPNANRKIKRTAAPSDFVMAAEAPGTGETVAECVMIDVREVDRSSPVLPQQIKRELSASPLIFTGTQAMRQTLVAERTPVGYPRKSKAGQSSAQKEHKPMTEKKVTDGPRESRDSQVQREETEKEEASALRKSSRVSERLSGCAASSPHIAPVGSQKSTEGAQWLALGKTPRKGMFRWLRGSSAEPETVESSSPMAPSANESNAGRLDEQSRAQDSPRHELLPADHHPEHSIAVHNGDGEPVANERDGEAQPEARGAVESGGIPTAQGILHSFQSLLDTIKRVTFGPEEERAMVGVLFESVKEVHEAGRRHGSL